MIDDTATLPPKSIGLIIRKYALILFVAWTGLIAMLLTWDAHETRLFALKDAQSNALTSYDKDVAFRDWATTHGGVYVPIDENTPPNQYLSNIKERDLITPSGRHLTLMNPAYMARQMNEFFSKKGSVFGHITSLKLKNPNNKPDKWEEEALKGFEKGEKERIEISNIGDAPFLRLMRPIITKEGCLKCHADQGYKVGDIRGGVTVSVGLEPYYAEARTLIREHSVGHGLIWLLGSLGLLIGHGYARRLGSAREDAREALKESELAYRTVAEFTYNWETWIGPGGEYLYVSPSCERISGYTRDEFIANPNLLKSIARHDDREKVIAHFYADKEPPVSNFEFCIFTKSGEERWISHSCQSVYGDNGDWLGRRGSNTDITPLKQAEREVYALNRELDDRVKHRTALLDAANKELEAFSYSVSHDLRAPLRSLDGFSLAVLNDYGDKLDERGKDYLRRIRGGAKKMGGLIEDMLKLSHITRDEMRMEKVNLTPIAKSIGDELRKLEPQRIVKFVTNETRTVEGDVKLLRVALENLIGNSWKFTGKTQGAKIEFGEIQTGDETVFFVRDNGAGFDMSYKEMLFSPFHRLHTSDEFEGTGIGLATVKRIITRHGGRIWAEAEVGKGSTFYFVI
jgi:PAS domain S-box-containing protein